MPPFLLGESHGDDRMGLARIFGVCAALLFASSVNAAQTIDLGPSDWRRWGDGTYHHHTRGLNAKLGQTVRMPPMNTSLSVTRNPVIPYGSIVNGMRNFVRINPASVAASAAVTSLFLAVDWVFDQESGSWMKEGAVFEDPIDETGWYFGNEGGEIFPDPDSACNAYAISVGRASGYTVGSVVWSGNRYHKSCRGVRASGQWTLIGSVNSRGITCPSGYQMNTQGRCAGEGVIDLDASDWQNLESHLPSAPAGQVGSAAGASMRRQGGPLGGYSDMTMEGPASTTGPETTTTTTTETGDTVVTSTTTTTNYNYGETTITTSNTTTSTTYQNGQEIETTVTEETPGELPVESGGGASGEWPGFCEWATVVCDWFDWTQEDPPPDEPLPALVDEDFFEQKNISFGAKSCPPDHEINLAPFLETTVGVSFQPLCDFAALVYYMVMAASYIIAAYISIGVARNA